MKKGVESIRMTPKEYLQQLQRADVIIQQRIQEKEELRAALTGISSPDFTKERVQGGNALSDGGVSKKVIKLIGFEMEIDKLIDDYSILKHRIIGQIHNLNNADQIKVLYKRYVLFEKFEQIAIDLGYSIRNVYTIHGHALLEFKKIIGDE